MPSLPRDPKLLSARLLTCSWNRAITGWNVTPTLCNSSLPLLKLKKGGMPKRRAYLRHFGCKPLEVNSPHLKYGCSCLTPWVSWSPHSLHLAPFRETLTLVMNSYKNRDTSRMLKGVILLPKVVPGFTHNWHDTQLPNAWRQLGHQPHSDSERGALRSEITKGNDNSQNASLSQGEKASASRELTSTTPRHRSPANLLQHF